MSEKLTEIIDLLDSLCKDPSISKSVRAILEAIRTDLNCGDSELGVKIDTAMQKIEDVSLDPNISTYARAQIWNLTSMLEFANKNT